MSRRTTSKTAFITGASSGIGEALAMELSEQGYGLGLCARGNQRLGIVASKLRADGARILDLTCDVGQATEIAAAVTRTFDQFGSIDLLIANAGYCVYGDFEKLDADDYERQMRVNLFGVLNTIRPALQYLKKSRGRIVITGSVSGHIGLPGRSAYAMSKFALRGLAESLAIELAGTGVSVTLVTPGYVRTSTRKVDRLGTYREEYIDSVPAGLQADPRTVARKILRAAAWRRLEIVITGHALLLVLLQRWLPGFLPRFLMLKQALKYRRALTGK